MRIFHLVILFGATLYVEAYAEPLSASDADLIIKASEESKEARQAARLAKLEEAEVLSEGRGILADGRPIIVREVVPPELPKAPAPTESTAVPAELSPEKRLAFEQQSRLEQHKVLMLSATVYDEEITRLSWNYEGMDYTAFANVNFNYLRGVREVRTDSDHFSFFMSVGDASRTQNPYPKERIPSVSMFSGSESEYLLLEGNPDSSAAFIGLEALLAHYDAHFAELKAAYQRHEALAEARKRYRENSPKEPEPFIMQFWVPNDEKESAGE